LAGLEVVNLEARLVIAEQFRGQQGAGWVRGKVVDGAVGGDDVREKGEGRSKVRLGDELRFFEVEVDELGRGRLPALP
jgi:hypothetical protein